MKALESFIAFWTCLIFWCVGFGCFLLGFLAWGCVAYYLGRIESYCAAVTETYIPKI